MDKPPFPISDFELGIYFYTILALMRQLGIEATEDEIRLIRNPRRRKKYLWVYNQIVNKKLTQDDIKF